MLFIQEDTFYRRFDKELLCIQPFGKNGFRVRATQLSTFQASQPSALTEPKAPQPFSSAEITGNSARLQNGDIICEVLCTGKLKFYNRNGDLLLEEYDKNRFRESAPGEADSALEIAPRTFVPHRQTDHFALTVRFEAKEGERFYGMGQYPQPYLNLRGCVLELSQRNSQVTVPFAVSNRGYGFLWNNPAIGKVVFGRNLTEWTADSTCQMDYWITAGDTPAKVVEAYADATGKVPLMPKFATGFWQSKLRYRSQQEVLNVAREYRKRGLPLSVIVIDFFHWTAQGDWKFDPVLWPDPAAMVRELKEMGIETMVSVWPTVEEKSENFKYMEEMGYLIRSEAGPRMGIKNKDTYMDATNPGARAFVWQQLKKNYFDKGIRLFWLDECEPEISRYEYENFRFYQGSDKAVGNIYPKEFSRMAYEGLHKQGVQNVVSLTRCAWAGSQKYGALVWTGDLSSDFASLKNQIANGLNMGLAGLPWWTTDIGGFTGGDIRSPEFRECFVRWFEFGAFCPVFRSHGFRKPLVMADGKTFRAGDADIWKYTSGSPNEVWSYGDQVYHICKKYLTLRERLRPYIDEQMKAAHEKGTPIMRPLFYDYSQDRRAWHVEDQYLFGPDILVAPVTDAGCRERSVYLPEGNWQNLATGEICRGGQEIVCKAALQDIPVFLKAERAASILPAEK
ncbi:MAG: family 31 glucosidase [Oscillospiraceae bacterium]|nr:family 31 glucosidase [Oscillospiraceae bacterium]MDD3260818.1 glycoside hydrolase family 31 protein [Oscillospiraceae bacterium]